MAQYVFWTGDETGVARAVEELIDENLVAFFFVLFCFLKYFLKFNNFF